ncbi:MAG: rhomboid family intramembrane serine protease [Phycisphaeraceae bacterium]|nr:rhomboid family intramembrane serine protease [Phycisphaeraceae bacterium]MCB9848126.1 rhomboid family intramembrane serine protease [Phycisphaeraceae bacterium]
MFPLGTDRALARPTLVNHLLLLACALVFVVQLLLETVSPGGGHGGGAQGSFIDALQLDPRRLTWYGFFTYQFLHGGMMHLLGNMLFLWVFGPNVEDRLGRLGYLVFYLLGGAAAGGAHVLLTKAPAPPVIGASGSISAVTGAYLVLFPRTHIRVLLMFIIIGMYNIPAVWFIGFAMAKDLFLQGLGGDDGVARLAHIGGYLYGAGVSLTLLATGLLSREAYDLFSLGKQAHRRRRFRELTSKGSDPWRNTGRVQAPKKPAKMTAKEEARLQARAQLASALSAGRMEDAARLHLALLQSYPNEVLTPTAQRDMANQHFAMGVYGRAAQAYERYLEKYPNEGDAPSMALMLALVRARYLDDRAGALAALEGLQERLHKADEKAMAGTLLEELHAAGVGRG